MAHTLSGNRFHSAWGLLLLAAAPAWGQGQTRPAVLHVRLPDDAILRVDGRPTQQSGPLRHFHSPPLDPARSYHYVFEWSYYKGRDLVRGKRTIHVKAGDDLHFDLTKNEGAGDGDKGATKPDKEPKMKVGEPEDKKPEVRAQTPPEVVEAMLKLAGVTEKDVVYDLDCGDGRIAITAANKYRCKVVGIDTNSQLLRKARDSAEDKGVGKLVDFRKADMLSADLSPATVVTMYPSAEVRGELVDQLKKLKKGTRIVFHDFKIEGYEPDKTETVTPRGEPASRHKIYLWEAPLKKK